MLSDESVHEASETRAHDSPGCDKGQHVSGAEPMTGQVIYLLLKF